MVDIPLTKKGRRNLLDFWTLCEITDFERFNLDKDKISPFTLKFKDLTKKIQNEYYKNNFYIDKKTNGISKLFIGIIKSEDAIKFIYSKLEERHLLPDEDKDKFQDDIESLPHMSDYTYMAYIYIDRNQNIISLSGKSLVINPLFYILKNLLEKQLVDTQAFSEFSEKVSRDFSEKYNVNQRTIAYIIPDLEYMLNLKNLNFLERIKGCKICILHKLKKDIEDLADSGDERAININNLLEITRKNKHSIFDFSEKFSTKPISDNYYLNASIRVASERHFAYVYLLTSSKISLPDIEIPINLYLTTFINYKKILFPELVYIKDKANSKITNEKLEAIFIDYCEILYLTDKSKHPANIFYTKSSQDLSIFKKNYFNKKFGQINHIEESIFLSFYINSLDEEPKKLAVPYMKGITNKIDINANIVTRKKYNSYELFTQVTSRWASSYYLYYAQQMAVNYFLNKLNNSDSNIFSINGPPGTGKTTLLKDVIAEIVTRRVKHCIMLDGNLFDSKGYLKNELCGKYETIVSSNNNTAVENITKELPNIDEFDFDYIGFKKDDFILSRHADIFYNKKSWNFISINLGKSENIKNFRDSFDTFKKSIKNSSILDKRILNKRKKSIINKLSLSQDSLDKLNNTIRDASDLYNIQIKKENLKKEISTLNTQVEQLKSNVSSLQTHIYRLKKEKSSIKEDIHRDEKIISLKKDEKSECGIFKKIFQSKEYKNIKKELSSQKRSLVSNLLKEKSIKTETTRKSSELQSLNDKFLSKQEKHKVKEKEYYLLVKKCNFLLKKKFSYHINDDDFYNKNEKDLQKSSLFADDLLQKEKAIHFALSMQLSEIFFLLNFDAFCKNIDSFIINHKKSNTEKDKEILQKNFSALFFILPVVSTSLASSYAMLKNIHAYGTLLCDESGQATPQSVIGLLNRANNALIVGDPLQVEPVFTAPTILINLLQNMHNVHDSYSPIKSSAQRVADNANALGSYYKVGGEKLWVGMPLVVHRRCIEPMFSISNKISYNEKMVLNTPKISKDHNVNNLPPSGWIDVKSQEADFSGGNVSMLEIEALNSFIAKYHNYLQHNYYIISPFKDINKYRNKLNVKTGEDKSKEILGTVHTFQGKEQNIVFFILGGNVKRQGAKGWVSSQPNILNVASTRAKYRIYFIGDHEIWKRHDYFKTAITDTDLPILTI